MELDEPAGLIFVRQLLCEHMHGASLALLALLSQLSYSLKIWSVFEFQFGLTLS